MKFLISFACLLAVASAGYAPIGYTSEARLVDPVAVAAGAPLPVGDTYEVAAAKAAHFAAHAAAKGQHFGAAPVAYSGYAHPASVAYSGYAHPAPVAYSGYSGYAHTARAYGSEARQVDPVAIAAGAPLPTGDTYEVAAAKAAHLAVHAAAKGQVYGAPAVAYAGHHYSAPIASEARLVDPVAIAAGAPLPTGDTYEVAAAKAAHLRAHAAAKGHFIAKRSPGLFATTYSSPLTYSTPLRSYSLSTYSSPIAYSHPYYTHY